MRISPKELADLGGRRAMRRKAAPRLEKDIQRAVLAFLAAIPGVVAWKTGGGLLPLADGRRVRMGRKGVSDIVGWRAENLGVDDSGNWCDVSFARFLAIEVKRPGKVPTPEQGAFLNAVMAAGGLAIVARSVDDVARGLGLRRAAAPHNPAGSEEETGC